MDRRIVALLAFVAACSTGAEQKSATTTDSAGGNVTRSAVAAGDSASPAGYTGNERGTLDQNLTGRIPVLEYHVIGGDKNALYSRTVASYKADLDTAYKLGYRPITIAQMLDKDFSD